MSGLNWRSHSDLVRDTMKLAPVLRDVDMFVGVPRSGMLPAAILATALHKPLGMCSGSDVAIGTRSSRMAKEAAGARIALVDDSVLTGESMRRAASSWTGDVLRCCVYLQPGAEEHVDHYAMHLPSPRIFEWNLFGSDLIRESLLDIDGVLCPDPPMPEEDRAAYGDYIATAPALHVPMHDVASICTNRIEPYRGITERWLETTGIGYGRLLMAPFDTPQARRRMSTPADLKSAWYSAHAEGHAGVLVESHDHIASAVAANVGRPVISMQSMRCFG